jgi:zinc transporter, ZIP family
MPSPRMRSRSARKSPRSKPRNRDEEAELSSEASSSNSPRLRERSPAIKRVSKGASPKANAKAVHIQLDKDSEVDLVAYVLVGLILFITIYFYPPKSQEGEIPSLQYVFYHGWITAVSTGLGVLPFFFVSDPNKYWMGISNSIAAGMMSAASFSLASEGSSPEHSIPNAAASSLAVHLSNIFGPFMQLTGYNVEAAVFDGALVRTVFGFLCGIIFIIITGKVLARYEDLSVGHMVGASAQKMVLIMFVMTLHSLTEGIGIGVSFGGSQDLGQFISTSLAVHNIPEGLAVALVLFPMRISKLRASLWAIFTSLPQPLMALPAFMFVQEFKPLLPVGLGFASGAMAYVAVFELLKEAITDVESKRIVAVVTCLAFGGMIKIQGVLQ